MPSSRRSSSRGSRGGVFTGALAERRRRRTIEQLRDHYIICGYGRVGRRVAEEFREAGVRYVVLDFNADAIEAAREHGALFIEGNGTKDEDLEATGLAHAKGLVASSDSDVDNLYITLSARTARPDLLIVARASDEDVGREAAARGRRPRSSSRTRPPARRWRRSSSGRRWPRSSRSSPSPAAPTSSTRRSRSRRRAARPGRTIRELRIRHETGAVIVALRKQRRHVRHDARPDAVLDDGDVMIAAGSSDELRKLEELFAPREAVAG